MCRATGLNETVYRHNNRILLKADAQNRNYYYYYNYYYFHAYRYYYISVFDFHKIIYKG